MKPNYLGFQIIDSKHVFTRSNELKLIIVTAQLASFIWTIFLENIDPFCNLEILVADFIIYSELEFVRRKSQIIESMRNHKGVLLTHALGPQLPVDSDELIHTVCSPSFH